MTFQLVQSDMMLPRHKNVIIKGLYERNEVIKMRENCSDRKNFSVSTFGIKTVLAVTV